MNIGGLVMLLLVVAAGVMGLIFIAANINHTAPVDSAGATVGVLDNKTRDVVTGGDTGNGLAGIGASTGVFVALIVAVGIIATAMVFLIRAKMGGGGGNFRSRY